MNDKIIKGVCSVILIAFIITIFELLFYIYIVNPNIILSVNKLLNQLNQKQIDDRLEAILIILKEREKLLIDNNNFTTYIVIITEIFGISLILYMLYMKLKNKKSIKEIIINSFITLTILISFQILFYYLGLNFKYMSKSGIKEIEKRFSDIYFNN